MFLLCHPLPCHFLPFSTGHTSLSKMTLEIILGVVLFQSPLLEQKRHEGRTSLSCPQVGRPSAWNHTWQNLRCLRKSDEWQQWVMRAGCEARRRNIHFYKSTFHDKHSVLKSYCRSNKTHQEAESSLCHQLRLGQARLQVQFPVWVLGFGLFCFRWFCLTIGKYIQPKIQLGLFSNLPSKHNYLLSENATGILNQILIR